MKIIGVSGVAGAGKDLFFDLLSKQVKCEKFSLADSLKREARESILSLYGIDVLNCCREQKNIIRPFLVGHGLTRRKMSNGRHWIDRLEPEIKEFIFNYFVFNKHNESIYPCVTDIRYNEHEKDEVGWLKNEMNGVLVHVSTFRMSGKNRVFTPPANEEERKQNPTLKASADYIIEWEFIDDAKARDKILGRAIKDFVRWL
jgi:hypothetical protein